METHKDFQSAYVKAAIQMLLMITVVFLVFDIFYIAYDIAPLNYILGFFVAAHLLIFALLFVFSFDYKIIKTFVPFYLIFVEIFIYPLALFFWKAERITEFLWFLLIPLACIVFDLKKIIVTISSFTMIFAISIFLISPLFGWEFNLPAKLFVPINVITVIGALSVSMMLVWHYNNMNQIVFINDFEQKEIETETTVEQINDENDDKLTLLYAQIQEYFETEHPYRNCDFNIVQLANKLNSNISYVSKAIKLGNNSNFNQFINERRINLIVSMLNDGYLANYTLSYIYSAAGFKHQSTFNAAFHRIMKMTPSEYVFSKKEKS